jgi:hydroxymethylpyrimidine pyrophosphatase-like HAD family hydrolase
VTKLLARDPGADLDTLLREASALAGRACTVTTAGDAFVELMAPGVSKHAALVVLAAERGIEPREIVAFGDQRTDAGMLAWAGLGVAVANAHPEALAAADLVTATNDDDGVAIVLEEMLARGR